MKSLLALLLPLSLSAQSLVDIGNGDKVLVFPQGAYVPNAWIQAASDSVDTWRYNADGYKQAVVVIASYARENDKCRALLNATIKEKEDALAGAQATVNDMDVKVKVAEEKVRKRTRWAWWSTGAAVLEGATIYLLVKP